MTNERYRDLMDGESTDLTQAEIDAGWHFCPDWDCMLIGPGMKEMECCDCLTLDVGSLNGAAHPSIEIGPPAGLVALMLIVVVALLIAFIVLSR